MEINTCPVLLLLLLLLLSSCKFRVLDTFGTEPQFNYRDWKPAEFNDMKDKGQEWANWNLNPRQMMTLYRKSGKAGFGMCYVM